MEACRCSTRVSEVTAVLPLPFPLAVGGGVQGPCQGHFLHPLCLVLPCVCSVSDRSPAPGTPPRSSVETSAVLPAPDPGLERALSVSVLSLLSL